MLIQHAVGHTSRRRRRSTRISCGRRVSRSTGAYGQPSRDHGLGAGVAGDDGHRLAAVPPEFRHLLPVVTAQWPHELWYCSDPDAAELAVRQCRPSHRFRNTVRCGDIRRANRAQRPLDGGKIEALRIDIAAQPPPDIRLGRTGDTDVGVSSESPARPPRSSRPRPTA
jgi:hypothetical protein